MEFNDTTVIELIKMHPVAEKWVHESREYAKEMRALIDGKGFHDLLINRIEGLESLDRGAARKKYSKDIRDLFQRVTNFRENVFQASGGSEEIQIKGEKQKDSFVNNLKNFKGGKSITKYLSEYYFKQADIDPNGIIFLEYKTGEENKVYPTFKSIDVIRHYEADGQKLGFIIFEPKRKLIGSTEVIYWRVVDQKKDWTIKQVGSETFIIDIEKTFEHPFGEVPAVILSDQLEIGNRRRLSFVHSVVELAKDYARDKSILTIYKFQQGFPKHWAYVSKCRTCFGTGKTGNDKCTSCNGSGVLRRNDVTDQINIELPKEGDPVIAPNIAGFIQPDLDTWKQYKEDLKDLEELIEHTLTGSHQDKGKNETATGRFIDVQPVTNELNKLSDKIEWAHNVLANWTANLHDNLKPRDENVFHKSYGRRFIIESPDVILDRYEQAREKGVNSTILDKLFQEFILSKYKTDPIMQEQMLRKSEVEPYLHYSLEQVFKTFGRNEALRKTLFNDFWEGADHKKEVNQLKKDFEVFFEKEYIKYNQ